MERREFLKAGAVAGAGALALSVVAPTEADASLGTDSTIAGIEMSKIGVRTLPVEDFYTMYDIHDDIENFQGMAATTFFRGAMREEGYEGCWDWMVNDEIPIIGKAGYDYKDKAMHHNLPSDLETGSYQFHAATPMGDGAYQFSDTDEAADMLLRTAYMMGASEVGIAPYEPKLMYQDGLDALAILKDEVGFEPKSVVVIAYQMNREAIKTTPLMTAAVACFQGYAQIALQSWQLAKVINNLGYNAYPSLVTLAPAVGYGALAGLGEVSRPGILINPRLGMNFRLVEVFTDIEATPSGMIEFGLQDFCKSCMKCADNCPSDAISRTSLMEQSNKDATCTNQSFTHWATDALKCHTFWTENHCECARCIVACPFTKEENWLHQSVRIMAGSVPGMHNIAREMDDLFGYGADAGKDVEGTAAEFWGKNPEYSWKNRR